MDQSYMMLAKWLLQLVRHRYIFSDSLHDVSLNSFIAG